MSTATPQFESASTSAAPARWAWALCLAGWAAWLVVAALLARFYVHMHARGARVTDMSRILVFNESPELRPLALEGLQVANGGIYTLLPVVVAQLLVVWYAARRKHVRLRRCAVVMVALSAIMIVWLFEVGARLVSL